MSAFQNLRQNPFDSNYSDRVMDEEIHTIAEFDFLPGVYGIILQDRPSPTTVVIVENNTAQTPFTEVLTTPSANQYRVSYTRGIVQFNSANAGDVVAVNYSGRGTNVTLELLQAIISTLASTFTNIIAATVAGLTFKNNSNANIATFGAGGGTNSSFVGSVTATDGLAITTTNATTPGIRKSDDTDTGLDWSAADQLDMVTGGSPRFRVESTGQIKAVYESQVGTDYNTTLHNGYLCRAWVNFNGQGTIAIRASGNVSSLVDNNTGDYSINFTVALPDTNYSITGTAGFSASAGAPCYIAPNRVGVGGVESAPTTSACRINAYQEGVGSFDAKYVNVAVFR
jgi:hypothetical protein